MTREIKFRAWYKENKVMLTPDNKEFENNFKLYPAGNYSYKGEYAEGWLILMQYTGLRDKNGKEIYEGDIVKKENKLGEVRWNTSHPEFYVYGKDGKVIDYKLDGDFEVIGNIYENPELVKESK